MSASANHQTHSHNDNSRGGNRAAVLPLMGPALSEALRALDGAKIVVVIAAGTTGPALRMDLQPHNKQHVSIAAQVVGAKQKDGLTVRIGFSDGRSPLGLYNTPKVSVRPTPGSSELPIDISGGTLNISGIRPGLTYEVSGPGDRDGGVKRRGSGPPSDEHGIVGWRGSFHDDKEADLCTAGVGASEEFPAREPMPAAQHISAQPVSVLSLDADAMLPAGFRPLLRSA